MIHVIIIHKIGCPMLNTFIDDKIIFRLNKLLQLEYMKNKIWNLDLASLSLSLALTQVSLEICICVIFAVNCFPLLCVSTFFLCLT